MDTNYGPANLEVDWNRIERQAREIRDRCGPVLAVVKADAYGLGAGKVAETIASIVDGFCVFSLSEAIDAKLWEIAGKPIFALRSSNELPEDFSRAHVRPAVWTIEQARRLRSAKPILCVDTGMQRFACPPDQIEAVIAAGQCDEAFTHAVTVDQAKQLSNLLAGRGLRLHAAASALLDFPGARLDAVRPGIALYRGAAKIWTPLVEVRDRGRAAGYSGFVVPRFGVILRGYAGGLRPGNCVVNGMVRKILEVGMQSAYVEIGPGDRLGDRVYLLGEGITEADIAKIWKCSEHEAMVNLTRLCRAGQ
jgi:alanine racemase